MEEEHSWLAYHPTEPGVPGSKPAVATAGAVTPIYSIQGDFNSASDSTPGMNARVQFSSVAHLPL